MNRHPDDSATAFDKFSEELNELLVLLNNTKWPFYCLGDFNVNLLNVSNKDAVRKYANMLLSCNSRCLIDVPTRVTSISRTLLDHIYTNDKSKSAVSGVLTTSDLSDYYGIFTIVPKIKCQKNNALANHQERDMTQFNLDEFLKCLHLRLSPMFEVNTMPVNELADSFLATFTEVVDQFAPKRNASRKERKIRSKPWISRGLLKSIQTRNRLFKQLLRNRDNSILSSKYKTYRNTLNRLLRRAKSNYYHSVLNEHKGNSKKAWETINELIYDKKRSSSPPSKLMNSDNEVISNPLAIAEEFNDFFTNVGKSMATLLPAVGSNNSKNIVFSKNKASNSIFLSPCNPQEVYHVINQLKEKKKSQTNIRHSVLSFSSLPSYPPVTFTASHIIIPITYYYTYTPSYSNRIIVNIS